MDTLFFFSIIPIGRYGGSAGKTIQSHTMASQDWLLCKINVGLHEIFNGSQLVKMKKYVLYMALP